MKQQLKYYDAYQMTDRQKIQNNPIFFINYSLTHDNLVEIEIIGNTLLKSNDVSIQKIAITGFCHVVRRFGLLSDWVLVSVKDLSCIDDLFCECMKFYEDYNQYSKHFSKIPVVFQELLKKELTEAKSWSDGYNFAISKMNKD